jgi:hypothetical protein
VPLSALLQPRALNAWLQQLSSSADSEAALRRLQSVQHVLELPAVAHCADLGTRERQQLVQVLRAAEARVTSRQQDTMHKAPQA